MKLGSGHSLALVAALAVCSVGNAARACSGCASPLEENRQAFVDTTIFLTVLPLMMILGFVWWLRRRIRQAEERAGILLAEEPWESARPWSKRP